MVDGGWWTFAAAGRYLGVSRERVRQLVAEGRIGTIEHFGRRYVSVFSVRALRASGIRRGRKLRGKVVE